MRRFLIWSGLAVLLGLVLAVSGYLAYDYFYARFRPVTIARNQGEIQRLLDEASWLSPGGGDRPLYLIGYRDSAATQAFERQEADRLRAAGVDVRVLVFSPPDREGAARSTPNERATVAELWLNRDWDLYRRWTAEPSSAWLAEGLAPADGNLARTAVVEASRQFVARLDGLMRDAGVKPTWPLVIWRDRQGFLKACACADSRSWAAIREDLGASAAFAPAEPAQPVSPAPAPALPPETPEEPQGLPYPDPAIAAPVSPRPTEPAEDEAPAYAPRASPQLPAPRQPAAPSARAQRPTAAPAPRPTRPTQAPPRSTRPQVQPEDTQFY